MKAARSGMEGVGDGSRRGVGGRRGRGKWWGQGMMGGSGGRAVSRRVSAERGGGGGGGTRLSPSPPR